MSGEPRGEPSAELAALRAVITIELAVMDYALARQERELKALRRERHIECLVASAESVNDNEEAWR